MDKKRNQKGNRQRYGYNNKLPYRLSDIEPCQNNKTNAKQHTHIVDHKSV